jgi:hypothetical protein
MDTRLYAKAAFLFVHVRKRFPNIPKIQSIDLRQHYLRLNAMHILVNHIPDPDRRLSHPHDAKKSRQIQDIHTTPGHPHNTRTSTRRQDAAQNANGDPIQRFGWPQEKIANLTTI